MLSVLLPLATLATAVAAQTPAPPPRFDGRRLAQRTDTFAQYYIRGVDTTRSGTVYTTLRSNGILLTHTYTDSTESQHDTLVDRVDGLLPVSHHTHSDAVGIVEFTRGAARGFMQLVNGDTLPLSTTLPVPAYNAASLDVIVRASDLGEGFHFEVPGFRFGTGGAMPMRGRVTGIETVDGRECWVIRATNGVTPVTFWVDRETRDLRRQVIQFGAAFFHLLTRLPASTVEIAAAEKTGLTLTTGGARHAAFDFVIPLPGPRFVFDTALQRQTNEAFGDRDDFYGWALRDPAQPSGGIFIRVFKGFDGTEAGLRRFLQDVFKMDFSAKSWLVYEDSVYWSAARREYRASVRDSRNIFYQLRCLPSPPGRTPGLVVCAMAVALRRDELDASIQGLRFGRSPE